MKFMKKASIKNVEYIEVLIRFVDDIEIKKITVIIAFRYLVGGACFAKQTCTRSPD